MRAPVILATALFALSSGYAPFQCASKPDPSKRFEEEPAEALYTLAEKFKAEGNDKARTETLEFIVKKYPASRFAEMARLDLGKK